MKRYKGIDIGRVLFACLIPLMHISFTGMAVDVVRQYLSRLGVPFFFTVTGMFLSRSVAARGGPAACRRFAGKVGRMLLIWLAIYLPILLLRQEGVTVRELLFKTPAYLWYLTGVLVAAVPFCLVRNRTALFYGSLLLYGLGTALGESYRWLTGGWPAYESIFLTTRNGVFFALPLLCVGERTWRRETPSWLLLGLWALLLGAEITLVSAHASPTADRSMYFTLPLFIYELALRLRGWEPHLDADWLGGVSTAIYVMQFGIITAVMKAGELVGVSSPWIQWVAWLAVMGCPTAFYLLLRKTKLVRILF